jgi:hypothetical protein
MNISSQYEVVKGSISGVTHTCDRVFRRGSTFVWKHYTLDPGIGAPYVWGVATCPTCKRLFVQPPRFPAHELRETLREAVHGSLSNPHIQFAWDEESAPAP